MNINRINTYMAFKSQPRYEIVDKALKKDSLQKLINSFQYLDIAYCSKSGQFGVLEYAFKNGKKAALADKFFDGITKKKLSDKTFLQTFLDKGYNIDKITYNSRPARDVFQKVTR